MIVFPARNPALGAAAPRDRTKTTENASMVGGDWDNVRVTIRSVQRLGAARRLACHTGRAAPSQDSCRTLRARRSAKGWRMGELPAVAHTGPVILAVERV